jgi:alpha-L-rhamnosidase
MFAEVYRLPEEKTAPVELARQPDVKLLPRHSPRPDTTLADDFTIVRRGNFVYDSVSPMVEHPDYNLGASKKDNVAGFELDEIEYHTWDTVTRIRCDGGSPCAGQKGNIGLKAGEYALFDSPCNRTGLVGFTVVCDEPGEFIVMFDEKLKNGRVDPMRNRNANAVVWRFTRPGTYEVESLEPCTGKFFQPLARSGSFTVSPPRLRLYRNALSRRAVFRASDIALEKIFAAAEETFAQNAVDALTDCPGRERAGWLCDSYFTGRAERLLCGDNGVERQFLENYSLPDSFDKIPRGMFPMCYPADSPFGKFIPSWAMFLVLELEEYSRLRADDRELVERFRPKIMALIDYLDGFLNGDGLLEKLPSWVFVEWSRANSFVQDVNYPNNMVYAAMLDAAARLYDRGDLAARAENVRREIRRQSWTGEWFCDNAVRQKDGTLKLSGECTETCQYYAFYFGTATGELYPELYRRLLTEFGPDRTAKGLYPKIHKSNAFIGNFLRLDWLSRSGRDRQVYDEMRGYFLYMAEQTGTLWELISDSASCCHGFEGHVAVFIARNVVGVRSIDAVRRKVVFAPPQDLPLEHCELGLPAASGSFRFSWRRENGKITGNCSLPEGWTLERGR